MMHSRRFLAATVAVATCFACDTRAASVRFAENTTDQIVGGYNTGGYVDIFVTPEGGDYLNHDMIAIPYGGRILDPASGRAGAEGGVENRVDTWVNTPSSSLGLGMPTIVYSVFCPGAPPFSPPDPWPEAGGPVVDRLNWTVFDTFTGDNAANAPAGGYHLGRVVYEAGGWGTVEVLVFDEGNVQTGGQSFMTTYGIPEPAGLALGAMGALVVAARLQMGTDRVARRSCVPYAALRN